MWAANIYDSPSGRFLPLYEGKMVQAFDHRAASVVVNPAESTSAWSTGSRHRGAASEPRLVP